MRARWEDDNMHTPSVRFYGRVAWLSSAYVVMGAFDATLHARLAATSVLLLCLAAVIVAGQAHLVSS